MVQNNPKRLADPTPDHPLGNPQRSERRERRAPLFILLRICGFSAGGRIFSEVAGTVNISPSGCCVRLHTQPLPGSTLAIQVIPREGPHPPGGLQMLYEIAWQREQAQGQSWDVGLFALGDADLLQVAFEPRTP